MKTLSLTLAAALVATSATAALALDGPHVTVAAGYQNVATTVSVAPVAPQAIDTTSAATLRLNTAGDLRSSLH